jgi:hypothetical protein
MRRRRALPVLLALPVLAAACASAPPPARLPEITFTHLPPINLDVARIELVDRFEPSLEPPHVESELPVAPAEAAHRWVADRLVPAGSRGTARVVVGEASAIVERLATASGLSGLFSDEQERRYTVALTMRLEIVEEGTRYVAGYAQAAATKAMTVPEGATLDERDRALHRLVEAMMRDFDRGFEDTIRRHLARFVR